MIEKAKELLLTNAITTWEEAKNLLTLAFRPTIDQKEITRKINNLRVSSVLDLINKIEYILADIHTVIMYENNKDSVKSLLYSLVVNKVKELSLGNLAREIRDEYDFHKIKKILYSYVGFDQGNLYTDRSSNREYQNSKPKERKDRPNNQQPHSYSYVNQQRQYTNFNNAGQVHEALDRQTNSRKVQTSHGTINNRGTTTAIILGKHTDKVPNQWTSII